MPDLTVSSAIDTFMQAADQAGARTALGLGSAATQNTSAFDSAGAAATVQAASLQKASNLSDVASASSSRTNLGLGSAATQNTSAFDAAGAAATALAAAQASSLQKASNLADLSNVATARTNLGLGTAAVVNTGTSSGNVPALDSNGLVPQTTINAVQNIQTGDYSVAITDAGKWVIGNSSSPLSFAIPPNGAVAFPLNTEMIFAQFGSGQVTIVAGVGVAINSASGLKLRAQYSTAGIKYVDTDTWILFGDLTT